MTNCKDPISEFVMKTSQTIYPSSVTVSLVIFQLALSKINFFPIFYVECFPLCVSIIFVFDLDLCTKNVCERSRSSRRYLRVNILRFRLTYYSKSSKELCILLWTDIILWWKHLYLAYLATGISSIVC